MAIDDLSNVLQLTADIVSAFVSSNTVQSTELSKLIQEVHSALVRAPARAAEPEKQELVPAVAINRSITPEYIVCLEDGRKFKSMKRHLGIIGMTPDEYRARWDLPHDYPMVAPNYSKARSGLAKSMGLGRNIGVSKKRRMRRRAVA